MKPAAKNDRLTILAIDPGYDRLGVAILEEDGRPVLAFSDCLVTDRAKSHDERLASVGERVSELIKTWRPGAVAVEKLFFSKNRKTALLVSQAIGIIVYEAARAGLEVFYYTPAQVKVAVTGHGRSDKNQIMDMIPKLVKLKKKSRYDDEYDAIAVGLAHLASRRRNHVGLWN